jgi:hypothetical protein
MAKKILLGILGAIVLFIVVVLGIAATKPDEFRIERSREIAAERAAVTPLITELRNWERWSPWAELDPNMTITYSDPSSGVGAWYDWTGNAEAGAGRSQISSIDEGADRTVVDYHLTFREPMQGESDVTFEAVDQPGGKTRVTWRMESEVAFAQKIFCVFMDLDAMVGADFEKGLERMDRAATAAN